MHYNFEDFFYLFYCPDKTGMGVLFHRNMHLTISFPVADIGSTIITLLWLLKELKTLGLLHLKTIEPKEKKLIIEEV